MPVISQRSLSAQLFVYHGFGALAEIQSPYVIRNAGSSRLASYKASCRSVACAVPELPCTHVWRESTNTRHRDKAMNPLEVSLERRRQGRRFCVDDVSEGSRAVESNCLVGCIATQHVTRAKSEHIKVHKHVDDKTMT